jgi:hypothetical protein
MKLTLRMDRKEGLAFALDEIDNPFGDAAGVALDYAAAAAEEGVTQAEVQRRAWRMYRAAQALAAKVPPVVKTVLKTPEELEADEERRRAKRAALAEAKSDKKEKRGKAK